MNRRELLKLFMASQIPLGGLIEKLSRESKPIDCKIEGWDVSFSECPLLEDSIQCSASKTIRGKKYHFAVLFDKDDKIEQIRTIMESELKRIQRKIA